MFGDGTPSTRKMFFRLSRPCFKPAKEPTTPERTGGQDNNIQKPSERLSARNKEGKQAFAKPFRAR